MATFTLNLYHFNQLAASESIDTHLTRAQAPSMPMTSEEQVRYSRQTLLQEFGVEGQERLKNSSVLCIGTGGLGSPSLMYLAAAGVGKIGLIDPDVVDLSNLHRQILHDSDRVGTPKLESARSRVAAMNPHVEIVEHPGYFDTNNCLDIVKDYDLIIDGSDNFPTRFCANDAAFLLNKPLVHGAIFQFEGQVTVFAPHLGGPCYRCLLPEPPPEGAVPT
jgi:molybdopterin/thiamine biosynthesis adenylyltransferase